MSEKAYTYEEAVEEMKQGNLMEFQLDVYGLHAGQLIRRKSGTGWEPVEETKEMHQFSWWKHGGLSRLPVNEIEPNLPLHQSSEE